MDFQTQCSIFSYCRVVQLDVFVPQKLLLCHQISQLLVEKEQGLVYSHSIAVKSKLVASTLVLYSRRATRHIQVEKKVHFRRLKMSCAKFLLPIFNAFKVPIKD